MATRSKKIMKSAKGEACTVRLIGTCNSNPETTVFAHIGKRRGMAIKSADYFGVYACSSCHDAIDGRAKYDTDLNPNLPEDLLRGLEETQEKLVDKGLMEVK